MAKARLWTSLAAVAGLFLLAGCTVPVSADKIGALKPNETTYDQVVKTFGLPDSEIAISGGTKVALYAPGQFRNTAEQRIPFYNLFHTRYDTDVYDFFVFNRQGVLQSYSIPHFMREAGMTPAS